jgi:hypothetical protein
MAQQAAFGTTLKAFDVLADYAYETVAYVTDIQAPKLALDALDTSEHASTDGKRTAVAGVLDGGEMTLEILYDPAAATHDLLLDLLTGRTGSIYQVTYPDATVDNFQGYVTRFEPGAPFDDLLMGTVTLRTTGRPLFDDSNGYEYLAQEGGDPVILETGGLILMEGY